MLHMAAPLGLAGARTSFVEVAAPAAAATGVSPSEVLSVNRTASVASALLGACKRRPFA